MNRPIIKQEFFTFSLAVQVTPTPINSAMSIQNLIDTIVITLPVGSANSVFFGASGVTITNGLEIVVGTTISFAIDHEGRKLYEIQQPLLQFCPGEDVAIPFVVFDPSTTFLIASAVTNVSVGLFKVMYL